MLSPFTSQAGQPAVLQRGLYPCPQPPRPQGSRGGCDIPAWTPPWAFAGPSSSYRAAHRWPLRSAVPSEALSQGFSASFWAARNLYSRWWVGNSVCNTTFAADCSVDEGALLLFCVRVTAFGQWGWWHLKLTSKARDWRRTFLWWAAHSRHDTRSLPAGSSSGAQLFPGENTTEAQSKGNYW